jgi:hypothetical protein
METNIITKNGVMKNNRHIIDRTNNIRLIDSSLRIYRKGLKDNLRNYISYETYFIVSDRLSTEIFGQVFEQMFEQTKQQSMYDFLKKVKI